jgi:hypothetical protein
MEKTLGSTRFKIVLIALLVAVAKELAEQFGVMVSAEMFYSVEVMLLGLAGLDTVRPLGYGKD